MAMITQCPDRCDGRTENAGRLFRNYADALERDGATFGTMVMRWYRRWQSRRALAQLSPEQRVDVGLSSQDIAQEIRKPFWIGRDR